MNAAPMIEYICPQCGRVLRIPQQYAGTKGTCKRCGSRIAVPPPVRVSPLPQRLDRPVLIRWVDEEVHRGIPCEVVLHAMANADRSGLSAEEIRALEVAHDAVVDRALDDFQKASRFEVADEADKAVRLYEQQITKGDLSGVTHDRLRNTYMKRGDYANAIRVCRDYVNKANLALANHWTTESVSKQDLVRLATTFQRHVADLRGRQGSAGTKI